MNLDKNYNNLANAILLQAVRDYFVKNIKSEERKEILKDLRSPYMDGITNGASLVVADRLEKNPEDIAKRINAIV